MNVRIKVVAVAAAVLIAGGTGAAVAAGSGQNATCTANPVITNGATVQSFDVHCSVPKLPAVTNTVTRTVTATPAPVTSTTTVTAPPQTVTVTETPTASPTTTATGTATVAPPPPVTAGRTAPTVPHMTLAQLLARYPGTTFPQACRKLDTYAVIDLPAGYTAELVDFLDVNAMSLYCKSVLGFQSDGSAVLTVRPYSATQHGSLTLRQSQGIDDNQSTGLRPYPSVNIGWTLNGTPQRDETTAAYQGARTMPMLYPGIVNYLGRGSYWADLTVTGFPGDWNYPPGETFQISDYKTVDAYYRNLHVDGRIAAGLPGAGTRVGGSPFGSSGSRNVTIEDSWFGYSRASSLTFSYAGSEETGQNTDTVTVRNTTIERNANGDSIQGHRFTGINFEGVRGAVLLDRVNIIIDNPTLWWDQSHVSIASAMIDNPNYRIVEPTWNPLASWTNGAFVVEEAGGYSTGNKQTSPPVVIKGGVQLQPFVYRGTPPQGYVAPVDPAKQFIVFTR